MRVISAILSLAVTSNAMSAQVNTHQVEASDEKTVESTVVATNATEIVQVVQALETNATANITEEVIAKDIEVPLSDSADESVNATALLQEEVREDKLRLNEKHARRAKRMMRRQSQFLEGNATANMTEEVVADIDVPLSDSADESVNETALLEEEVRKDKLRLNEKHARRAKRIARRQSQFLEGSNKSSNAKLDPPGSLAESNVTLDLNETQIALDIDEEVRKDKARMSKRLHRQLLEENITADVNATEFLEDNVTEFLDVNETEELEFKRSPRSAKRFARKNQRSIPMPKSQRSLEQLEFKRAPRSAKRFARKNQRSIPTPRSQRSLGNNGGKKNRGSRGGRLSLGARGGRQSRMLQRRGRMNRGSRGGRMSRGSRRARMNRGSRGGRVNRGQRGGRMDSGARGGRQSRMLQLGARSSRGSRGGRMNCGSRSGRLNRGSRSGSRSGRRNRGPRGGRRNRGPRGGHKNLRRRQ